MRRYCSNHLLAALGNGSYVYTFGVTAMGDQKGY